jgi:uncharacterized protein YcbK (DUF882 family)
MAAVAHGERLRGGTRRARERSKKAFERWQAQVRALEFRRRRTAELLRGFREDRTNRSLLKLYRHSRGLAARSRGEAMRLGVEFREAKAARLKWEKALAAFRAALRRPYPHLGGDLDADDEVLRKLEGLARDLGRDFLVTSGLRSQAEQKLLWDNRHTNRFPVAFCCPCESKHCLGRAVDVTLQGLPIQSVVPAATIRAHGLEPLAGDAVHLEG